MIPSGADKQPGALRSETAFWLGLLTTVLFLLFDSTWLADLSDPIKSAALFMWLFAVMLLLTMAVSSINFGAGRTNVMQGAVHLILFVAYIVMIFD